MSVHKKVTAIADAIRNKTGREEKLSLDEMAVGVGEVYEAGKQAEYDAFWDEFQESGNRKVYDQSFSFDNWTDGSYNPKYDMLCEGNIGGRQTFSGARRLTDIKVPIRATNTRIIYMFSNCTKLKRIPLLEMRGVTDFNNAFFSCSELEELNCLGEIGINGFNLQWSPKLSKASIESIINCLSTATNGLSVTLSKTAVENAFDSTTADEWTALIATRSNWTITLI